LKCFSGIQRFIQLNNIDEKCLEKAAENLQIRKVKKHQYFLHEGEPTGFFAGLIKGKVSIRKTHIINRITNEIIIKPLYKIIKQPSSPSKFRRLSSNLLVSDQNSNNTKSKSSFKNKNKNEISPKKVSIMTKDKKEGMKKNYKKMQTTSKINFSNREERNNKNYRIVKESFDPQKYIVKEEELFRQSEGYCFGEWALIYKEPRAASVYTLEDCIFFILDEVHFKNSFLKSLNNSEYSKKKFALQHFLPFDMMVERQLSIYKNIVPITCKRNQIIFEENDISNCIYLVYLGGFTLEKKFGLKQFKILDLGRGSIVGLESIFDGENSK
jgi:CRP-like cAMP-binding protein